MPASVGLLRSRLPRPIITVAATVGFSSRNFAYLKGQRPALSMLNGDKELPSEGDEELPSFLS